MEKGRDSVSITEILGTTPNTNPQYVDVGVQTQTNTKSTFQIVKDWFLEVCSVRSSELSSLGQNKVAKWRKGLEFPSSLNSTSNHTIDTTVTNTSLDRIVNPGDSASNIKEVVSESNLDDAVDLVYNITDPTMYVNILREPGVEAIFSDNLTQTFLKLNEVLLTVDPSIVNYFI